MENNEDFLEIPEIYYLNKFPLLVDSKSLRELKKLALNLNPDVDGFDAVGYEFYSIVNSVLLKNGYKNSVLYIDLESNQINLKYFKNNVDLSKILESMDIEIGILFEIFEDDYKSPKIIKTFNKYNQDCDVFIDAHYRYSELHITLTDINDTITIPYFIDILKLEKLHIK